MSLPIFICFTLINLTLIMFLITFKDVYKYIDRLMKSRMVQSYRISEIRVKLEEIEKKLKK